MIIADLGNIYREGPRMYDSTFTSYVTSYMCDDCNKWFIFKGEGSGSAVHPRFCEDCYNKKWIDIILDRI